MTEHEDVVADLVAWGLYDHDAPDAPARLRFLLEALELASLEELEELEEADEYVLTDKGRDLLPVIHALREWGDRWVFGREPSARADSPRPLRTQDTRRDNVLALRRGAEAG